jgi:hypothetical protein
LILKERIISVRKSIVVLSIFFIGVAVLFTYLTIAEPEYAYIPPDDKIKNKESVFLVDLDQETNVREQSEKEIIESGKRFFYQETFGNEVFFTDILGMFSGAFTIPNITRAIIQLKGQGTDNLKVQAAKTVMIGDRTIKKESY